MRHPGSPRVEDLTIRSASWVLFVGWVALVVGVVLIIGAALPSPGVLSAKVAASARHVTDLSALEHGSRQNASDPGSMLGVPAGIADLSDNNGRIRTARLGTGPRGAFHAGDRSPIAVSSRIDLRQTLMELADWRRRQAPVDNRRVD
jgi:hypothetical protein